MSDVSKNYSTAQTEKLISLYAELGNDGIEQIADLMEKPVKSVIAKLVREKVYIAREKSSSKRTSTSKKQLLNELENLVGFDTTGLTNSTKESLNQLLDYVKKSSLRD